VFCSLGQNEWTIYNDSNGDLCSSLYTAVAIDQNKNIWVGGDHCGLSVFDGVSWTHYYSYNSDLVDSDVNEIVIDSDNNIWAGTYKGISVFDGYNFTTYDTSNTIMKGNTIYTLEKDKNGSIWIASRNGSFGYENITVVNGDTWTNLSNFPSQIDGREFTAFAFTSDNTAWIGSELGIAKYKESFSYYPKRTTDLWSSGSVEIDEDGNVWAGGFAGLVKYDGASWTFTENTSFGFPENTLYYDILSDGSYLWMGTSQGFIKYNRITGKIEENFNSSNSPLEDNCVTDIVKDSNGDFWLATTIGVVKLSTNSASVSELKDNKNIQIYPNPSNGKVNISLSNNAISPERIDVIDIYGKIIIQENNFNNSLTDVLDLSSLPKGIYILDFIFDKELSLRKRLVLK
jgi:ligand-binding sensor domain-containing protein